MLKKFFSRLLTSFIGAWLALVLFGVVVAIIIFASIGSLGNEKSISVESNSILKLELNSAIVETEPSLTLDYSTLLNGPGKDVQVLRELISGLNEGAVNDRIKALYIHCEGVSAAPATLHALRDALLQFKKSGKKIIAYGDVYSQADYYLASVSDVIYLNKMGSVALTGLSGTNLYFKDLLDKLGVKVQVFKVGTYKSAVEPFVNSQMSEPARAQLDTLYTSMWNIISSEIATSRKMNEARLNALVDSVIMFKDATFALDSKLVDKLCTRHEVEEELAAFTKSNKIEDINYVSPQLLASQSAEFLKQGGKNEIAVLYAEGEIAEDTKNGIDCARLVPVIYELADDEDVKAMVLRVNSPGGSVFGSSEIASALEYFQQQKKPLVVSMGDYAASGGYWISCHADKIIADPLTITGSIGVFGMIPDASGFLSKLGVGTSSVSTNPDAAMPTLFTPLTSAQSAALQTNIEEIYNKFVQRVATGRKLSEAKVREIAEGRVWSAATAQKLGLVDELGGLDKAIKTAAKMAKVEDKYNLGIYPDRKSSWLDMIREFDKEQLKVVSSVMGRTVQPEMVENILSILHRRRELALMPVIIFNY